MGGSLIFTPTHWPLIHEPPSEWRSWEWGELWISWKQANIFLAKIKIEYKIALMSNKERSGVYTLPVSEWLVSHNCARFKMVTKTIVCMKQQERTIVWKTRGKNNRTWETTEKNNHVRNNRKEQPDMRNNRKEQSYVRNNRTEQLSMRKTLGCAWI